MGPPVEDVAAITLEPPNFSNRSGMSDFLRLAESGTEPTLVIEGELNIVFPTHLYHRFRLYESWRHRLLAVDGFDTRGRYFHNDGRVKGDPETNAHDVEIFLLEHLLVVFVDIRHFVFGCKSRCVFAHNVRYSDDLGIATLFVAGGVVMGDSKTRCAFRFPRSTTADDAYSIHDF